MDGILRKKVFVIDGDPERVCETMTISDIVAENTINTKIPIIMPVIVTGIFRRNF